MEGWSWEKALDLYLQMEEYYGDNSSGHSTTGFVRVSPATFVDNTSKAFVESCEKVGIPITNDFNAPGGRYGAGFYNFNTRDGIRESVARTFLGPILRGNDSGSTRDNFHLMLNTTVEVGAILLLTRVYLCAGYYAVISSCPLWLTRKSRFPTVSRRMGCKFGFPTELDNLYSSPRTEPSS